MFYKCVIRREGEAPRFGVFLASTRLSPQSSLEIIQEILSDFGEFADHLKTVTMENGPVGFEFQLYTGAYIPEEYNLNQLEDWPSFA